MYIKKGYELIRSLILSNENVKCIDMNQNGDEIFEYKYNKHKLLFSIKEE